MSVRVITQETRIEIFSVVKAVYPVKILCCLYDYALQTCRRVKGYQNQSVPSTFLKHGAALREIAATLPGRKEKTGSNPFNKSVPYSARDIPTCINLLKEISTIQLFNVDRELTYLCSKIQRKIIGLFQAPLFSVLVSYKNVSYFIK